MSEEFKCPICGESTFKFYGNYRKDKLCSKHATDLKNRKIEILDQFECFGIEFIDTPIFINSENDEVLNEILDEEVSDALKQCYTEWPRNGYNNCILCSKKSYGYAFCKECYKNSDFKKLQKALFSIRNIKNESTADTVEKPTPNINKNAKDFENLDVREKEIELTQENQNNVIIINETNKSKCITCGRQSEGLLFCSSCYHKYKNKELLFKITNCTNVELLDENYEGKITCTDGHIVKSKAEYMIDNYLYKNNIIHAYEKGLPYGATQKEVLHPDFYLPNYLGEKKHVYIKFWGYNENNIKYTNSKKFKMDIYKQKQITLINVYEKDTYDIETNLDRKLNKEYIKENQINGDE